MTAEDIRAILAKIAAERGGPPRRVRSDNGPEFAAEAVRSWLEVAGSGTLYVAPGSRLRRVVQRQFRDEFLNREKFKSGPKAMAAGTL